MGQGESLDEFDRELGRHPSLSAAIIAAEERGATPDYIAQLRQAAVRQMQIDEPAKPIMKPVAPVVAKGTPARYVELPPRKGCGCRRRYDVYLDNDFGPLARLVGGGVGIGTLIMIRLFGLLGALAIACGLAGMGGIATIISICVRCEGCRHRILDLDSEERADLKKGRGLVILVTAGFLAGAAICGYLWWSLVQVRVR